MRTAGLAIFVVAQIAAAAYGAEAPLLELTLAQVESAARAHSLELKAAVEQSAAVKDQADALFASLLPRLTLDGYYRYQTEVPTLSLVPGMPPRPFTDHRATSIGPTLTWTLWDEGAIFKTWKAQKAAAASQEDQARLVETQAVLGARLAYVQVQLAREQVLLLSDSVAFAVAQVSDIDKRLRAGAASRIDYLSSHQVELQRRKDFLQAQAALGVSLRQLLQLIGQTDVPDLNRPIDSRITHLPEGLPAPTVSVSLDRLSQTPAALAAAENGRPDARYPGVTLYERRAESARLAAQSASAQGWPRIQLQGSAYYQYPNTPLLESVFQKTAGLTASFPLFEGGLSARQAEQQKHLAAAAERSRELAAEQLARDWDKAKVTLAAYEDQQKLDDRSVREAEELARLVYQSYRAGRSTFLAVQTYDLNALQAKVQATQTRAEILIELATLAQLSQGQNP